MDAALIRAIFERLTGYPVDSQGRALLDSNRKPQNVHGSYGLRIPMRKKGVTTAQSDIPATGNSAALRPHGAGFEQHGYNVVPVFFQGTDGRKFPHVFPSCSFNYSGLSKQPYAINNTGAVDDDPIDEESTETDTITSASTGEEIVVPSYLRRRKHPDMLVMEVAISVYSRDPVELILLDAALLYIFPLRGAIQVTLADGSTTMADYWWERYAVMDRGEAFDPAMGVGPEVDGYLKRTHVYSFETLLDNSVNGFGTYDIEQFSTILQTIVDFETEQERYLDTVKVEDLR